MNSENIEDFRKVHSDLLQNNSSFFEPVQFREIGHKI